jgi:hypothetical protein
MWTLGHSVREVGRTRDSITIEETATKEAVLIFGAIALAPLIATYGTPRFAVGGVITLLFVSAALYASVRSTFTADRSKGHLVVDRHIAIWTKRRVYQSSVFRSRPRDRNTEGVRTVYPSSLRAEKGADDVIGMELQWLSRRRRHTELLFAHDMQYARRLNNPSRIMRRELQNETPEQGHAVI